MSKLDEIISWMATKDADGIGNKAITVLFGCDEALVRKARHKAEIASLRAENGQLRLALSWAKDEIAHLEEEASKPAPLSFLAERKARLPKRPKTEFYPLFSLMESEA